MQCIPLAIIPATYYCQRKRKLTIISFFYGWHQKKLWWSSSKLQPTHWTFVTSFHFMLVGYKNYLYCFDLYIQQLIGHSFYMLCWNCHMWIFSPWFFSIDYFGKIVCINSISFLRKYTRFLAHGCFWLGKNKCWCLLTSPNDDVSRK